MMHHFRNKKNEINLHNKGLMNNKLVYFTARINQGEEREKTKLIYIYIYI